MSGAGTGLDQMGHLAWMQQGEGGELYKKLYQDVLKLNVVPFQVIPDGPEALGWFKRPIASLEDFRKMKFRTPPGLPGQVYTEMGVSVTGLPGPEIIPARSEEHTSELQSLMRSSYAVFCLKKTTT